MRSRVAVNLLWLLPGAVGGSEEYTVGLLRAVAKAEADDLALTVFAQPGLLSCYPNLADEFEVVTLPKQVSVKPARFALESSWLATKARGFDLVHHGGGVAPYGFPMPVVVTIHDLQPLDLAENFSPVQQRWFQLMLPRAVRVASRITCPSNFTATRIVERLDGDRARIDVVSPVHQVANHAPDRPRPGPPDDDRFLLFPAMAHHHKRHVDAIDALAKLGDGFHDVRLVFTGAKGPASGAIEGAIASNNLGDRVAVLGRVAPDRLDQLLHDATAVVFPSVYEGFGNPVIEAMARDTPVIAADTAALCEVVGDAGLHYPAGDPTALSSRIVELLSDGRLQAELRRRGRERAREFDEESASQQLLGAYRGALA